jgi:hypothetical protein
MALTVNHPLLKEVRVYGFIADSAAASSGSYVISPIRGRITKLEVCGVAVVDADRVITTAIGTGAGTAITGGAITMTASGSAAGSVFSAVPTAANNVNEGDVISFLSDAAGSTACPTHCVVTIQAA